jgi:4-nitrophenyl phosphatase
MSTRLQTPEEYEKLLDQYDTWLFDCDGVLWRGDHLIEGVIEVLDLLRRRSASLFFAHHVYTFAPPDGLP